MVSAGMRQVNDQLDGARRIRAEWLLKLQQGETDLPGLLRQACQPGFHALLRLPLTRVIAEQPGYSTAKAVRILGRVQELLGAEPLTRPEAVRLKVQWLVDGRSGGRRLMAFCDATRTKEGRPWPGVSLQPGPGTIAGIRNGWGGGSDGGTW